MLIYYILVSMLIYFEYLFLVEFKIFNVLLDMTKLELLRKWGVEMDFLCNHHWQTIQIENCANGT